MSDFIGCFSAYKPFLGEFPSDWILYIIYVKFYITYFQALPQTLAFITGDFNLDDLIEANETYFGAKEFFLIFVILVMIFVGHIVIMNVFTGLAVGDVEKVQINAKDAKMFSQMKFLVNFLQGRDFR